MPIPISAAAAALLALIQAQPHDFTNHPAFTIWAWRECEALDLVRNLGGMNAEITPAGLEALNAARAQEVAA